jgi:DNA-binding response OmpR family regulator
MSAPSAVRKIYIQTIRDIGYRFEPSESVAD